MTDKTLAEHLAEARDRRKPENLIAGAAKARAKRPPPKPCNCGLSRDGKHAFTCPVYQREQRAAHRRQKETD